MTTDPSSFDQLTPLGLMALAVLHLIRLVQDGLKRSRPDRLVKIQSDLATLVANLTGWIKSDAAIVQSVNDRLREVERELNDLTERHKDPNSPFATIKNTEALSRIENTLALIRQTLESIERSVP